MSRNRTNRKVKSTVMPVHIQAARSGDWFPVETLLEMALAAAAKDCNIVVNLAELDHLDTSALQILLALVFEQKKRGHQVHLMNTSPMLRQWFEYSGAEEQFLANGVIWQ